MIQKIIAKVEGVTGTHVQVKAFELGLSSLTADLRGVTVHGNESSHATPLFQAEHIHIVLRLLPLLRRRAEIDQVVVERPELFVESDSNGRTNLPAAPAAQSGSGFHVAVHYAQIRNGAVIFNDFQIPLAADIYGLQGKLLRPVLSGGYQAELQYGRGQVRAKDFNPIEHSLLLRVTLGQTQSRVEELKIVLPHSQLSAEGTIDNYRHPQFNGTFRATVSGSDAAFVLRNASIPSGDVSLQGSLRYAPSSSDAILLNAAEVKGTFTSSAITVREGGTVLPFRSVRGSYSLKGGLLRLTAVRGDVLGGTASSDGAAIDLARNSGSVGAELTNVSLLEAGQAWNNGKSLPRIASKGRLQLAMNWKNGPRNSLIEAKGEFSSQSVQRLAGEIPLDGSVNVSYDVAGAKATVRNSSLKTLSSELSATGTLAKRSEVNVWFSTTNLHELVAIGSEQGAQEFLRRAQLDDLRGAASFQGLVSGTVEDPHVKGLLTAGQIVWRESEWQTIRADFKLDSGSVQVTNGLLQGPDGSLQVAGTVPLANWSVNSSADFSADAKVQQLSVAVLQKSAGTNYPVEGLLNGEVHLSGSVSEPKGNGHLELVHGAICGETLSSMSTDFQAGAKKIQLDGKVHSPAGAVTARVSYEPATRRYELNADLTGVNLSKLNIRQADLSTLEGSLSGKVTGGGSLDDPQLKATVHSAALHVHNETLSNLQGVLELQNHRAKFQAVSTALGTRVSAKGNVALTGDYIADVNIDTGSVEIGPILQIYAPAATSASGTFELHATAKGPLKQPEQIQAHLEIPALHLIGKNVTLANVRPIQIDYAEGMVKLVDASLRGPGTELNVSGSIPVEKAGTLDLTTQGNLDLTMLEGLMTDTTAGGQVEMQVQVRGTRSDPNVSGSVKVTNAVFASDALPIGIESLNGTATLQGKRIRIEKLSGTAGGGTLDINGTLDLGANPVYALTLTARSTRIRENGVWAVLDADLNLDGSGTHTLSGRVAVKKLSFEEGSDLEGLVAQLSGDNTISDPSPFERKIKLNVSVQSEQEVGLTSSQLSISGSANLLVVGTVAEPILLGRAALTGGEVFFLGKRFELRNGTIAFANAARTSPILDLNAGTEVEQYNITIHLSGSMDRLKTTYTSDPSLASADIINLLAFGRTTGEAESRSSTPGALGAQSAVASAVGAPVAGQIQKLAGISQVTIDPLAGSSQNPGAQIAIQQRVSGNLLVTFSTDVTSVQARTVQLKYQLNRNVTVSILRDENGGYGLDIRYRKAF
ncbi:MAG TPA: translocation/assembly module TamB domain-containing protein [Candidatus Acidoferrum sp.]